MINLIEKLKLVKDFRENQGQRHPLWLILIIIILGIMQGYVSYRALGDFSKNNQKLISTLFCIYPMRTPSFSTIRRVMIGVDWKILLKIFNEWAQSEYGDRDDLNYLSIDGKSLNSTVVNAESKEQNFVMFVSLFSQETGLVLHLKKSESKKGSEIEQFQGIVRNCGLENKIFTGDSLHCQRSTVKEISSSKNNYLLQVKANQKKLHKKIKEICDQSQILSSTLELDKSHGRIIKRKVAVFEMIEHTHKDWESIKSVIKVERSGRRGNKPYDSVAYYISNIEKEAKTFAKIIKGHWTIENQLHWVKDVILEEDDNGIADSQPATNLSVLKTWALNLLRSFGFTSIKEGQRWMTSRWSKSLILTI